MWQLGQSESDHVVATTAKTMVNSDIVFTMSGDIIILSLTSECYSANDATATRIKYTIHSALDGDTDISGQTASLANAIIGTRIICDNTTLGSVPNVTVSGVSLNMDSRGICVPRGYLKLTVSGGSTTGTWRHYIRYEPLEPSAVVSAAQ